MKMVISVPMVLMIAVLAAACGKNNDAATTTVVAGVSPAPVETPPGITPLPSGEYGSPWCYQRGGSFNLENGTCRLTETTQFGWNKYYGRVDSRIYVYASDSVTVQAEGTYKVYVAGISYSGTFIAQRQGTIILEGDGFNSFKMRSITITRCYKNGYAVSCQ